MITATNDGGSVSVSLSIEVEGDVNSLDDKNKSQLVLAVENNDIVEVKRLLAEHAEELFEIAKAQADDELREALSKIPAFNAEAAPA